MARVDPSTLLPDVEIGPGTDLSIVDVLVGLLVLAFFVVTLLAVLRRLAVI